MNFKDLLKDHPEFDEIWISRIVDADQVRAPNNLHDLMANLCELFAATVGEDDVKLFKYHVMCGEIGEEASDSRDRWKGTIIEIPVNSDINFEWSHSNLERGRTNGAIAAEQAYKLYKGKEKDPNKPLVVGRCPENSECSNKRTAHCSWTSKAFRSLKSRAHSGPNPSRRGATGRCLFGRYDRHRRDR